MPPDTTTAPQIRRGLPLHGYLRLPAFGSSDLKAMRAGPPAMVPWQRANPMEHTEATLLGTAAHCLILEPHLFASMHAHKPAGMKFSTKDGIAWKADIPEGVRILTDDQWTDVQDIAAAFHGNDLAERALKAATEIELSLLWTDPETGLALKTRPDLYDGAYLYELKITRHASARAIGFRAWAEGWMHQLAHEAAGLRACGFDVKGARIIAIGPTPPQSLRVFTVQLKVDALDAMNLENEATLRDMAECVSSNIWPGVPDEWRHVDIPAAALREDLAPIWPDAEGNDLHPITDR